MIDRARNLQAVASKTFQDLFEEGGPLVRVFQHPRLRHPGRKNQSKQWRHCKHKEKSLVTSLGTANKLAQIYVQERNDAQNAEPHQRGNADLSEWDRERLSAHSNDTHKSLGLWSHHEKNNITNVAVGD